VRVLHGVDALPSTHACENPAVKAACPASCHKLTAASVESIAWDPATVVKEQTVEWADLADCFEGGHCSLGMQELMLTMDTDEQWSEFFNRYFVCDVPGTMNQLNGAALSGVCCVRAACCACVYACASVCL
jgi:hypothetical protein